MGCTMTLREQLEKAQKELKEAQATIKKLQEDEVNKDSTGKRWDSVQKEWYYFISAGGYVVSSTDENDQEDSDRYNNGNKFKTMKLATYYANKRAARNRLECLALAIEGRPHEFKYKEYNWYIFRDGKSSKCDVTFDYYSQEERIYFSSEENARLALDGTSYEDIMLLWGGI